ncbi:MAG: hypothetical protein HPY73_07160 [Methanomassiliicoccales archaeon]|nr:MAG: hypothetical protein HPY73_07160 [Methanomassiliicoccales archaeon]
MKYTENKRPWTVLLLTALLVIYGIMGIVSGVMLIVDPSGGLLGFTEEYREKVPFNSFLPVGLFLFCIYGIGPLLLAYGAITRKEMAFEWASEMTGRHWSWTGGLSLMVILVAWLLVEGYLIGLDFAATYFTVAFGVAIFIALMLPANVRYYKGAR